ncbi:hypothetical protein Tco_0916189 [Tanacetum coccineum]
MKKRRTGKDVESSKKSSKSKESDKGKTLSTTSKSSKSIPADKSVHETEHVAQMDVKEPNLDNVANDADEPQADASPKILKKDWFKKSPRPETLDPDYYKSRSSGSSAQPTQRSESPVDMSKPLPLQDKEGRLTVIVEFFFNYDLEYLKAWNKERMYSSSITKTPVARYTMEGIEDMILTLWSPVKIAYDNSWNISLGTTTSTILQSYDQSKDLHLNDIEYMLLLIDQNKLFNLEGDVIVDFVTALKMFTRRIIIQNRVDDVQLGVESYQRKLNLTKPQRTCPHISVKEPYTLNFDPPGIIYEDKSKKKRIMRIDEIHKFCDGTLQSVCNILRERLLNFKFSYNKGMPSKE